MASYDREDETAVLDLLPLSNRDQGTCLANEMVNEEWEMEEDEYLSQECIEDAAAFQVCQRYQDYVRSKGKPETYALARTILNKFLDAEIASLLEREYPHFNGKKAQHNVQQQINLALKKHY